MEPLMTTEEVAEILRIDAVTVRRLVARGELPAYRIAGEFRFSTTGLESFIESQRVVFNPATTMQMGKFTERARKVLSLANEEARGYNHREVGPEHLLLAVQRVEDSVGARTLRDIGVQPAQVRASIEAAHPVDAQSISGVPIGMSAQGKDTMELAVQEARSLDHHYLGTEHFVLALLRQEDSLAGRVLSATGATYEAARKHIEQTLQSKEE